MAADNNIRLVQTDNYQIVRGDSASIIYNLRGFILTNYLIELDIIDPFTKKVIPMALGTTYSKTRNVGIINGEGIYYFGDTNGPSSLLAQLTGSDDFGIKLSSADTLALQANLTYKFDIRIKTSDDAIVTTIVRGTLNILRSAIDA